jgi:hypothetical protein
MALRMLLGLTMTAVAFSLAGGRLHTLIRLARAGQPADPDRTRGLAGRVGTGLVEVLGQAKLLRWSLPGIAHLMAFWGFIVLGLTLVEGYGALSSATSTSP